MLLIWTLSLLLGTVAGSEVCYSRVGCFTDDEPWGGTAQRPFKVLPSSPEDIDTRFLLYTNENPNNYQEILPDNVAAVKNSNFNTNRITHFIVHGFLDEGEEDWLTNMCASVVWSYKVTVTLSGTKVTGKILVSLFGSNGNSRQYEIYNGSLQPDATHSNEIDSDFDVGTLEKVKFLWDNNLINLTRPTLGASTITVQTSDGETYNFCSSDTVKEEVLLTLNAC
ncbi:pancreatic triacylglycerol lipase-like [Trichosurus vulpecula]|uniref:pancreatic triacylglycerol lipase-like n=1 Tax=Trichosurus vulpecula TaxID=9337 RepID=UPI00186B546F|nr:pancreatic triacylglycerol lipase-like [Trichosurus vulpecula]